MDSHRSNNFGERHEKYKVFIVLNRLGGFQYARFRKVVN